MDRIINVKVGGNYLSKDNKNAGVKGEANVTYLRITFDEGWDGYAKTVTFWDAHGGNPVKRTLTADLIENLAKDARTYLVPIPAEPLAEAGELTFVIDGYIDGKRQRSISDKLVVKDAPMTDAAEEPTPPTPTQAEEFQQQYDGIMAHIQGAAVSRNEAKGYRDEAEYFAQLTQENTAIATGEAGKAEESAIKAENAVGKTSYIGDNGNWFAWDSKNNAFYDTGVKAQAGSTVYMGENPPAEADVWIDPNGESGLYAPYIASNGNWYTFNPETQTFTDSGVDAKGYIPQKGTDYYTEEEKQEMIDGMADTYAPKQDLADTIQQLVDGDILVGVAQYSYSGQYATNAGYADNAMYADLANNARYADNAYRDRNYNEITEHYATKEELKDYVDDKTAIIQSDIEGLQKHINEEAHFRGYMPTNAKIQAMEATPNDFAYSAESGTKWVYDADDGWQDTNTPVPDQLTPASDATPLINGVASAGTATEYARGDHRHPTDTTRLGVEEFNIFKADLENGLDNIIAIQNTLIGGGSV